MPRPLKALVTFVTAAFLIIYGFSSVSAEGQPSPSPAPTPSPKLLDRLIVTAARHPATLGSTSREAYVIDADDLRRSGAQSLGDALQFVPGVVVQTYGPPGSLQDVLLRGASSEQTLVLVDGRPVNEPDTGVTDFSYLPLDGIDRIEIVEGGASMLYGSGAVGGVINIITKTRARSDMYAQVGYAGAFASGLTLSGGDPKTLAIRATTRHERAQNVFDYPDFAGAPRGTRTNNDADIFDTNADLTRAIGSVTLRVALADNAANIGAPGSVAFGASGLARQQRYVNRGALFLSAPDAHGAWALDGYADDRRLHFFDPTSDPSIFLFPYDTLTHVTSRGVSIRHWGAVGPSHTVTFGYEARGDRAMFDASYYASPTIAYAATTAWFVHDEYRAPRSPVMLSAGIRSEHAQGTKSSSVPAFGLQWNVSKDVLLKANYARAFRLPTLDERYFPGFSNPNLEPEYSGTADLGLVKEFDGGLIAVTAFAADTNNLIVFDATGMPSNVNRSLVRGANLDIKSRFGTNTSVHASYTDYFKALDVKARTRLLFRPTATGALEIWHRNAADEYGASLVLVGRRFADEANTQRMPAYSTLSLHYARNLGSHYVVTVRADNLLRGQVEGVIGYPVNGPTIGLRLEALQ